MIKQYRIYWSLSWNKWYFDMYREWFMIVTKEYNHSRLSDFKQALKLKALQALRGL